MNDPTIKTTVLEIIDNLEIILHADYETVFSVLLSLNENATPAELQEVLEAFQGLNNILAELKVRQETSGTPPPTEGE